MEQAVIIAGGKGSRLSSRLKGNPKPLVDFNGKPLLYHQLKMLGSFGFNNILILAGHKSDKIHDYVKSNNNFGLNIKILSEKRPLGTGGAILNALPSLGSNPFVLINADIFHNISIKTLPRTTKKAHLVGVSNPEHNMNGDFSLHHGAVSIENGVNDLTWSGVSVINPIIFEEIKFQNTYFNIWDSVLPKYIDNGEVTGEKSNELWIDVGTSDRLELANQILKEEN